MAKELHFNEAMGSPEEYLNLAGQRLHDIELEIEDARAKGKPEAYMSTLEQQKKQAEEHLVALSEQINAAKGPVSEVESSANVR